jgi:hypothetical protein
VSPVDFEQSFVLFVLICAAFADQHNASVELGRDLNAIV